MENDGGLWASIAVAFLTGYRFPKEQDLISAGAISNSKIIRNLYILLSLMLPICYAVVKYQLIGTLIALGLGLLTFTSIGISRVGMTIRRTKGEEPLQDYFNQRIWWQLINFLMFLSLVSNLLVLLGLLKV